MAIRIDHSMTGFYLNKLQSMGYLVKGVSTVGRKTIYNLTRSNMDYKLSITDNGWVEITSVSNSKLD